jgi:hypothetical protein
MINILSIVVPSIVYGAGPFVSYNQTQFSALTQFLTLLDVSSVVTPAQNSCDTNFTNVEQFICNMQGSLTHINLPDSSLYGTLPDLFGYWPALSYLDISNNYVQGSVAPLAKATSLWFLDLTHNQLYGDIMTIVQNDMPYLGYCYLQVLTPVEFVTNCFFGELPQNTSVCNALDLLSPLALCNGTYYTRFPGDTYPPTPIATSSLSTTNGSSSGDGATGVSNTTAMGITGQTAVEQQHVFTDAMVALVAGGLGNFTTGTVAAITGVSVCSLCLLVFACYAIIRSRVRARRQQRPKFSVSAHNSGRNLLEMKSARDAVEIDNVVTDPDCASGSEPMPATDSYTVVLPAPSPLVMPPARVSSSAAAASLIGAEAIYTPAPLPPAALNESSSSNGASGGDGEPAYQAVRIRRSESYDSVQQMAAAAAAASAPRLTAKTEYANVPVVAPNNYDILPEPRRDDESSENSARRRRKPNYDRLQTMNAQRKLAAANYEQVGDRLGASTRNLRNETKN